MDHTTQILLGLFVVYVAAQVGAEIAQRLGIPAVVGEIAAGVIVGPGILGWVHVNEPLEVLAEIGAVLLLFSVGLETRLADLKKVGRSATMVGVLGVILPFVLGYAWAHASGQSTPHAMFIASAFVATSAGITARVLQDLGVLGRMESRVILGAAVIDDILAMLLLGLVTALQSGESVNIGGLVLVFAQAVGFIGLIVIVGTRVMRRASNVLDMPLSTMSPISLSIALCLGLAVAAAYVGLAAIIGAFLAGMIAAESKQRKVLETNLKPIEALLVPFFFVVTGAKVEISALASWSAMGTLALITLLATVSKVVGCGLGALSLGRKSALIVGIGMVPRGEVGIIVASLGKQANLFSNEIYALIIAMSLVTSVIAPPALKALLKATPEPELQSAG